MSTLLGTTPAANVGVVSEFPRLVRGSRALARKRHRPNRDDDHSQWHLHFAGGARQFRAVQCAGVAVSRAAAGHWCDRARFTRRYHGPRAVGGASGKSNLLDALRFLRDVAAIGLRQSVLDKRGGVSALRCLAATYRSDVQIEVTLVEGDGPDAGAGWRYRLAFNKDHRQEQPVIRCERVWHGEELLVERPNEEDRSDPERLTQTYLEQINANRGFRELAEFFRSIAYRHPVPEVIRDPKGFSSAPVINDPYGRDFLQRLWQTPQRTREARLRRINQVLQVAVPQFRELRVEQDETGTPHLVGLYEHWRPNAARQSEAQFSDGTLRLLGLLWALLEEIGRAHV